MAQTSDPPRLWQRAAINGRPGRSREYSVGPCAIRGQLYDLPTSPRRLEQTLLLPLAGDSFGFQLYHYMRRAPSCCQCILLNAIDLIERHARRDASTLSWAGTGEGLQRQK